jgi:SmpA / OmlA family
MTLLFKPCQKLLSIICLCFMLLACSQLTEENFNKVKIGMTMQQVTTILGKPSVTEKINVTGISGISATWKDDYGQVDIQFLSERVAVKAYSSPHKMRPSEEEKPETT